MQKKLKIKMIFLTKDKALVRGIFLGLVQEEGEIK